MRPELHEVLIPDSIDRKFPACAFEMATEGLRAVTMSCGQWDCLLQAAYDAGWLLFELDENERLIRIYRRPFN